MKKGIFRLMISLLFIFCTIVPHQSFNKIQKIESNKLQNIDHYFPNQKIHLIQFEDHYPIEIDGNADFRKQAMEEGWRGDGTDLNPYIIDGLRINGSGTGNLISISNCNFFFLINNCILIEGARGIFLTNTKNGFIKENSISHINGSGIVLYSSDGNTLTSNVLSNNRDYGIYLSSSDNNTITNNNISSQRRAGILLYSSDYCILEKNTIFDNYAYGNIIISSSYITITTNSLYNNSDGIFLSSLKYSALIKNSFSENRRYGIFFDNSDQNIIADNIINENNRSGIYLSYLNHSTITNNTVFGNYWSGIQFSSSTNNTITRNIVSDNNIEGISIFNSTHTKMSNNAIYNNSGSGVSLDSSSSSTTSDNIISNNSRSGIHLDSSNTSSITNNTIFNNRKFGIRLDSSVNTPLTNNNISNNGLHGVQLFSSNNSTIINNIISSNNGSGIHLDSSNTSSITNNAIFNNREFGFRLDSSVNNTLISNTISNNNNSIFLSVSYGCTISDNLVYNNNYGLHLFFSSNNIISRNIIFNKIDYGIYFSSSGNNTVSDNYLIDDGLFMSGSQLGHFRQAAVTNNLVNGNPLVYWANTTNGTVPSGAGQVILVNCTSVTITGESLERTSVGVFAVYCSNLSIYNNVLSLNNQYGIYLFTSANSTIFNNIFFNNYKSGIHLAISNFTTISSNTIHYNSDNGVFISSSNYSTIVNNRISNNNNGINISSSCNATISNNLIFDNDIGIGLHNSGNNTIEGNKLTDNGLFVFGDDLSYYVQEKVSNNTINGKTLIYWQNVTNGAVPEGTGQIILINCKSVKIIGQTLTNVNIGIFAIQCTNLTIQDNIISDNHEGIRFVDSINSSLIKNIIINSRYNGIFLQSSHRNIIIQNIISYNDLSGFVLFSSHANYIYSNFILSNAINGIDIWISNANFISKNRFSNNSEYGIYLDKSERNRVETNSFIGNSKEFVSQAHDQGSEHSQNVFSRNYWDDWTNPDDNGDGIVDYHYSINGSSLNYDPNPMTVRYLLESFSLSEPTVLFPNGRENLGGIITIQWFASSGIISHNVFYDVYYSFDDGITWIRLATGLTTTYYVWNTTTFPDGSSYYIRIIAFDSEGKMSLDISDRSFTINNSYSGVTLLKILIALNFSIVGAFIFILSCSTLRDIYNLNKTKSLSRDSFIDFLQKDLMNSVKKGKWVIFAVCGAFTLSIMRAWLIDPVVVVADRYDWYAINMKHLFNNWAHEIDRIPIKYHQFRIVYPLLIAILSTISSYDVILIGRLVSIVSFSISIYYLSKILERFKKLSQSPNKEKILIVFIMTPTMITNFVRVETDILFLALSLYIIHQYMMFIDGELNNLQKMNLLLAFGLLIFTREVSIVLILCLLLHKFLSVPRKYMLLTLIISFILVFVSLRIDFLQELLFIAIWNATGYTPAYEFVYNNNWLGLVGVFVEKMADPQDIYKIIESLVFAFPSVIFCFLGFIRLYRIENRANRKRILKNIITLYFITYFSLFILFRVGRGVDRFWIPILIFPLLLLPFTIDLKELMREVQKLIYEIFKWIYFKIFQRNNEALSSHVSSSFFNMIRTVFNLNDRSMSIFPKSTFYFIVITQILLYVVRLILSLIIAGILPVYQ